MNDPIAWIKLVAVFLYVLVFCGGFVSAKAAVDEERWRDSSIDVSILIFATVGLCALFEYL